MNEFIIPGACGAQLEAEALRPGLSMMSEGSRPDAAGRRRPWVCYGMEEGVITAPRTSRCGTVPSTAILTVKGQGNVVSKYVSPPVQETIYSRAV